VTELGKGGLGARRTDSFKGEVVTMGEEGMKPKVWSDKVATRNVEVPKCPACGGPCAAALIGLWCVICGERAYG